MTKAKHMCGGKYTTRKNYKKCAVCQCYKSANIILHKTPKNFVTRMLWCAATGIKLFPSSHICSNHFTESDYNKQKNRLKPGVVPSVLASNHSFIEIQTVSQSVTNLDSDLCNENTKDSDSSNQNTEDSNSSNQNTEDSNSQEEEQCYIYYLDEDENVSVYESCAISHEFITNIDNDLNELHESMKPLSTEINEESSFSNMDIDMIQSISDSCTDAKSLEVSSNQCLTENLFLEPYIGLNSSHFTTKLAWQKYCDIISEYKEQIYDLQDNFNILQTKYNRLKSLKELLSIRFCKI